MFLRHLELEEFRSYRGLRLDLDPRGLRLSGSNGSGKSTLLEAIALLATMRSPRSAADREILNWESGRDLSVPPFARCVGIARRTDGDVQIELALQSDPQRPGQVRKQIKLAGRSVRAMDAVGILKAVLFAPDDLALVSGPPAGRRRYFDLTLSQLDGRYLRSLSRYNRILVQRNSLLRSLAKERLDLRAADAQLAFWDEELVAFGAHLVALRFRVLRRLGELATGRFRWLSGETDLRFAYRSNLASEAWPVEDVGRRDLSTLQAIVSRGYEAQLREARREELRRGTSLVGPHRDDADFAMGGVDLAAYGSRGQQRLAVVALKLAEADLMREQAGDGPVLLLDDVLSELDERHRGLLVEAVGQVGSQVFVTATDAASLTGFGLDELPQATVGGGILCPLAPAGG
ncbi:MAG: DNA replication and repair protein RecF [Chloroflexota bacterium]|nr:DNA replication and repair protein RecF [Chloroflexota bacterium]